MGVSLGSVSSILKQKRETRNVEVQRKEKSGRKRKTTKRDDFILLRNSKIDLRKTSEELKRDLDKSGVHVSSFTVQRRLLEKGRKAKKEATVNRRNEKETIQLGKKTQRLA